MCVCVSWCRGILFSWLAKASTAGYSAVESVQGLHVLRNKIYNIIIMVQ